MDAKIREAVRQFLLQCKPCGDQYVILPDEREGEIEGMIVLPGENKAEQKQQKGEIVSVGRGRETEDGTLQTMQYSHGNVVVFKRHAGDDFYMNEKLEIFPPHDEPSKDMIAVKVLRQDSILFSLP